MKILFRFLLVIVIFEIILGYGIYIKNSSKLTGNYVSSTIKTISKLNEKFKKNNNEQNFSKLDCKENLKENKVFQVAGMNFYRRGMKFQTNIDFLNNTDLSNKYLILISGNSETLGFYQDDQKRLHTLVEKKLNEKFLSKDIIVVNISNYGQFINDHLNSTVSFSEIYKPDLVIFYTGGNEIKIHDYFKDMTNYHESLNMKNQYWYSSPEDKYIDKKKSSSHEACLDKNIFLTKNSYHSDHLSLDIKNYVKNGYNKIKKVLNNQNIDFIFYIHPFNKEISGDPSLKLNVKKLRNINIIDDDFVNLSSNFFDLNFVDNYHTRNSNLMANKIFNDILKQYEKNINIKISKKNN